MEAFFLNEDDGVGSSLDAVDLTMISSTCWRYRMARWPWPRRSRGRGKITRSLVDRLRHGDEESRYRAASCLCHPLSLKGDWDTKTLAAKYDLDGALFLIFSRRENSSCRLRAAAARALAALFDHGGVQTVAGRAIVQHHGQRRTEKVIEDLVGMAVADNSTQREREQAIRALVSVRRDRKALDAVALAGVHRIFSLRFARPQANGDEDDVALEIVKLSWSLIQHLNDRQNHVLFSSYPVQLLEFHYSLRNNDLLRFIKSHSFSSCDQAGVVSAVIAESKHAQNTPLSLEKIIVVDGSPLDHAAPYLSTRREPFSCLSYATTQEERPYE